jgi:hypothetical protein
VKKILVSAIIFIPYLLHAQNNPPTREEKKAAKQERVDQLIKQEEEGALIYQKQGAFGIKLNTDGYGCYYEHGRYKTITKTNLWWAELGERKDKKEDKLTAGSTSVPGIALGNPFIFGKQNNFYYLKLGLGQQLLIGGKGNKNGVAVSLIYGGGFSLGMLKPYYLQIQDPNNSQQKDIKYQSADSTLFVDPTVIVGASGFGKGFGEIEYVPGAHARVTFRFDYGRYNETLSAIEVGINAEYYTKAMPIMVYNEPKKFFLNAYLAFTFGRRK